MIMDKNKRKFQLKQVGAFMLRSEKLSLLIALAVIILLFYNLNHNYLVPQNLRNILMSMSVTGLVAIGETYLSIAGHIDLSAGAVSAFSAVFVAKMMMEVKLPIVISILLTLLVCPTVGLLNAFLVTRLKFNHFIATLASKSIIRGAAYLICDGSSIYINLAAFNKIGTGSLLGIPIPVIILAIMMLSLGIVLANTRFGRSIYMIGGNSTAARLAGMDEKKIKMILFYISAFLASIAGIVLAARINSGQPSSSLNLDFDAITAMVLGGVAMSGGIGTMSGCFIGLVIMCAFKNGLAVMNVQTFWQDVSQGVLLIAALTLDFFRNYQRSKLKL